HRDQGDGRRPPPISGDYRRCRSGCHAGRDRRGRGRGRRGRLMATTVRVDGLRELNDALEQLPKSTQRSVLRRVGLKALQPVADAARAMAPDDPATGGNDLRSSIGVGTKLSPRQAKLARRMIKKGLADK